MGWLSNIFNKSNELEVSSPSTSFHDMDDQPVALTLQSSDLRVARELVKTAAIQTALNCGVPAHWVAFEVVTIADDEKAYFQLQVTLQHWDEYFASHTYAFESAVLKRIRDDDLQTGRAVRAVLWRTSPDAGCPFDDMPEASAWSADAIRQRGEVSDRVRREMRVGARNLPTGMRMTAGAAAAIPATALSASDSDSSGVEFDLTNEREGLATVPITYDHFAKPVDFGVTQPMGHQDFETTLDDDDFQSTHGLHTEPAKTKAKA